MTTLAKDPPTLGEETKRKTWTFREVRKQEETLRELRERLAELADREKALSAEIADHLAGGGSETDVEALQEERSEVRDLRADLSAAEEVLAERIEERRRSAFHGLFRERLREIKKMRGGLAGEHGRRVKRLTEAVRTAAEELEKIRAAYAVDRALDTERAAICELTGLPAPETKSVPRPWQDPEIDGALSRLKGLSARAGAVSPSRKGPRESVRLAARELESHGRETETPGLVRRYLEAFGEE